MRIRCRIMVAVPPSFQALLLVNGAYGPPRATQWRSLREKTRPSSRVISRCFPDANFQQIPQIERLSPEQQFDIRVVSKVLPFRVNEYVLDELIDWDQIPNDPMFRLVFPQREMLEEDHFRQVADLVRAMHPGRNCRS